MSKFFTDVADQVAPPYCVITEGGESYEYMMRGPGGVVNFTTPNSQMMFDIWASSRYVLRGLGFTIAKALDDANLAWPNENNTMLFRLTRSQYVPTGQTGVGTPVAFHRVFFFEYMYSGVM